MNPCYIAAEAQIPASKLNLNVRLSWSGGSGPYQLQRTITFGFEKVDAENAILHGNWQPVGNPTMANNLTVPNVQGGETQAYYRVQHSVSLADAVVTDSNTKLFWFAPDLQ